MPRAATMFSLSAYRRRLNGRRKACCSRRGVQVMNGSSSSAGVATRVGSQQCCIITPWRYVSCQRIVQVYGQELLGLLRLGGGGGRWGWGGGWGWGLGGVHQPTPLVLTMVKSQWPTTTNNVLLPPPPHTLPGKLRALALHCCWGYRWSRHVSRRCHANTHWSRHDCLFS